MMQETSPEMCIRDRGVDTAHLHGVLQLALALVRIDPHTLCAAAVNHGDDGTADKHAIGTQGPVSYTHLQKSLKKSAKIGISWTVLIVIVAAAVGIIGRLFLGYDESINGHSLVFITMAVSYTHLGNIQNVMDGDIDGFINAYLTASANGTLKK